MKLVVRPTVHLDDKQNASGTVRVSTDHGNATYSVQLNDKVRAGPQQAVHVPSGRGQAAGGVARPAIAFAG